MCRTPKMATVFFYFQIKNKSVPFFPFSKNVSQLADDRVHAIQSYGISVHNWVITMDTVSVNKFRDNLKSLVEQSLGKHEPLRVTRRSGEDFVVVGAEDWEREQETLTVLQNSSLMQQLLDSAKTHSERQGYQPTQEEMDEITGL